jgi:hypothetical protein
MNHRHQEKMAAKKVAEINLEICKNKVEVINIKNELKTTDKDQMEGVRQEHAKEQRELHSIQYKENQHRENIRQYIKTKSNEIYTIIDAKLKNATQELNNENANQHNQHARQNQEIIYIATSNLQKAHQQLHNYIQNTVNRNDVLKDALNGYELLNLEPLNELLKERKKQCGDERVFYERFAPSKRLWNIHPYSNGEKLELIIENREKIDTLSSDILDNAMKLLDIISDKSKKIEEIEKDINEKNTIIEKLQSEYTEKNKELNIMKSENNKITDRVQQAQNNVNIVSFEVKVDEKKNEIESIKQSILELQKTKNQIIQTIYDLTVLKPYWESVVEANAELTNKEEEIWLSGTKSRDLKIIENNYTNLISNINRYKRENHNGNIHIRTHKGDIRLEYFTSIEPQKMDIIRSDFDYDENYKQYTESIIQDPDGGIKLFTTLIKKYELDYSSIISDIEMLDELKLSKEKQNLVLESINLKLQELNRIQHTKTQQIQTIEKDIIPELKESLIEATTLWELEKAYLEYEKASKEANNI